MKELMLAWISGNIAFLAWRLWVTRKDDAPPSWRERLGR